MTVLVQEVVIAMSRRPCGCSNMRNFLLSSSFLSSSSIASMNIMIFINVLFLFLLPLIIVSPLLQGSDLISCKVEIKLIAGLQIAIIVVSCSSYYALVIGL